MFSKSIIHSLYVMAISFRLLMTTAEAEKWCDCAMLLPDSFDDIRDDIRAKEPVNIKGPFGPCQSCGVRSISTFKLDGNVCAKKTPMGILQEPPIIIPKVHVECNCEIMKPDFSKSPVTITADWTNARFNITILGIEEGDSGEFSDMKFMDGKIVCGNPPQRCKINPKDLEVQCKTDDFIAKQACDQLKSDAMIPVMTAVVEVAFPSTANIIIAGQTALIKSFMCDPEEEGFFE